MFVFVVRKTKKSDFSLHLPVRADLDDGDSCLCVTMENGVKYWRWTSPPREQAGVNIQNPTAMTQHVHTLTDTATSSC